MRAALCLQLCAEESKNEGDEGFALPIRRFEVKWENLQESFRTDDTHNNPKCPVRVFFVLEILLSAKRPYLFHNTGHQDLGRCGVSRRATAVPESPYERGYHG